MPLWFSPFTLAPATLERLEHAGYFPFAAGLSELPGDCLLLYDTPDRCFGLSPDTLCDGYKQLQELSSHFRVVAIWRLLDLDPFGAPLAVALTSAIIKASPDLLDAYLNLELKADLLGDKADVDYGMRIDSLLHSIDLLDAWRTHQDVIHQDILVQSCSTTTRQMQVELEQLLLDNRTKAAQLESLSSQLVGTENLQAELSMLIASEKDAQEEAELTLLQLRQVQEELEHYFLVSRAQKMLISRYQSLVSDLLAAILSINNIP